MQLGRSKGAATNGDAILFVREAPAAEKQA